jgi:hypothetical protein
VHQSAIQVLAQLHIIAALAGTGGNVPHLHPQQDCHAHENHPPSAPAAPHQGHNRAPAYVHSHGHGHACSHDHDLDHGATGLGMHDGNRNLPYACNADVLQIVLQAVLAGPFCQLERVEGAAGAIAIFRVVVEERLGAAFAACAETGKAA